MTEEAQNPFISNYYGTPNILVDRLMPLLTPEEWMVLSFTCRQVLGWEDTIQIKRKRISLTIFAQCGLSIGAIRKALGGLERYRIMRRLGRATVEGQLWELAFNKPNIDWAGLEARRDTKEKAKERRTRKARQTVLQRQRQEAEARGVHFPTVGQQGPMLSDNTGPPSEVGAVGQHRTAHVGQHGTGDVGQQHRNTLKADDDVLNHDPTHHQFLDASAQARDLALLHERFARLAIPEAVWSRWSQPIEHQLACVLHAEGEGAKPPGLLRTMLDGDGVPLPKYVTKAQQILAPASLPPPRGVPPPPPAPKGLDEQPGGGLLTARDIWQAVIGQLKLQLNQDTYAYVRDAQLARFENGVFTIRPRLPYAARWFERSRDMLDRMISDIAGIPLEVRCEGYESGSTAAIPAGFADPEHIRHKECNT